MRKPRAAVLVVEDDLAICQGLLDVLVYNGYHADGEADGAAGFRKALDGDYDLIVLDVMLPSMDGFTLCRKIREKKPRQGILMLTAKGSEDDIVAGFKAGADDYVSKPFSLRELMVRVEAVLRRSGKSVGDECILLNGVRFDGKTLTAACGSMVEELTRREMDIISYLYRNKDRITSKKALLSDVWDYADTGVETRTVDIHILKLRKKIAGLIGEKPFIVTVRGEGYRLEIDE